jgi:hypothetical protein
MVLGLIPNRTKRFVSLPNCSNWLCVNLALLYDGYSKAAGGDADHSPVPSAEVKKDLSNSHFPYIPSCHAKGQSYSLPFIVVLEFHTNINQEQKRYF